MPEKTKPTSERARKDPEAILVKLFGSTSRARILTFLCSHSGASFYQRQIMFETGLSLQAAQRELANLVDIGIVNMRQTKNRAYYEMNAKSAFFKPLIEICGSWLQDG